MANIAFLGTGLLGGAFAEACAKRGDSVTAWNRSQDKVLALATFGVKSAKTPADAVRGAARVHLVLKDDAVVDEVIAAARAGLSADAVIIDHTTTLPTLTAERSQRLNALGIKYLHGPVFMGPPAARNAQGSMMVAGPAPLFERVKDDLAKMTGRSGIPGRACRSRCGEQVDRQHDDHRYHGRDGGHTDDRAGQRREPGGCDRAIEAPRP